MNTLVIYDNSGKIFFQVTGDVQEPDGIPFLWVQVPHGKIVQRIDVSVEPHEPILSDLPKSEIETRVEQAEADNLTTLEAIAEVYEMLLALQA